MTDLISRAAAIEAVTNADRNCLGAHGAREAIRALPAASQPEAEPVARGSVLMRDGRGYVDFATPAPVVPAEGLDALIGEIVFETVNSEIDRGLAGRIIAALRAQQPAAPVSGVTVQEAGWQPIETAPRDGTPIIATTNEYDEPLILRWFMVNGREAWRDWDADSYINVTHWMPLPEPPALSALEGK